MNLTLRILTPQGEIVNDVVDTITASGMNGEFGVLAEHLPFLSALKIGPAIIEQKNLKRYFALGEGYAEVFDNQVTLFVEVAEEAPEIDSERANAAFKRAEAALEGIDDPIDSPKFKRLNKARNRALNRLEVAKFAIEYNRPGESS